MSLFIKKEVYSMPVWNEQQRKAIHTKKKNIVVSASAGSGKTTVLVARLIDLVLHDRVSIEQILAMTFTEAAANEMKKRLAAELHKILDTTQDKEEREYIAQQLTNIQTANISTIHSFCLSILQNHYYIIGLDADRIKNIMDPSTMTLYQQEAMQIALQKQFVRQDTIFQELSMMFSPRAESYDQLLQAIQSLASLASSKPNGNEWLQTIVESYRKIDSIMDYSPTILTYFFDYLATEIHIYVHLLHQLKKILTWKYEDDTKKLDSLMKKLNGIQNLWDALKEKDYMQFKTAFIAICHILPPASPNKEDTQYASVRKQILAIEDRMLEQLFDERTFLQDHQRIQPYIARIIDICKDYRLAYDKIKEQENVIDFDDMEHFALAILQANDCAVAKLYQEQFVEIMVDEFQDSNDVQNELIQLICRENNVFRVGDIKQSIYGFRHAKPQLMKGLIEHQGAFDEVIYLSNNYRSKKMIVDFNNILFKQLMNIDGFDSRYTKEDDVETGIPAQLEDNIPIVFHAIDYQRIKEDNHLIMSKNECKADYIASQIVHIKNTERRKWKDFVVLVRSNARKDDLKAIFDELHIPYFIDIKHGFYQSNAVQIILSFLKACLSPHNDLYFIAMITSPLVQVSFETIASAKLHMEPKQSYYDYFKHHPFKGFEYIQQFMQLIHTLPLSEILNKLYNEQHFYQNHTTIQEKTNLDLLYEKAIQFEQKEAMGTAAFLTYIDRIKDAQTAEATPIGSEEDVVRVMSIHQSKGLQFPVVFLWSNTKQVAIECKEHFICESDLGIGMKYISLPHRFVRTSIQRLAIEHKKNKEELEEEMRILYVATTRAQQQMHIVDCIKSVEEYEEELSTASIYARGGYTSWVLQTFLQKESNLFKIHKVQTLWKKEVQKTLEPMVHILPSYAQKYEQFKISTASKNKQTKQQVSLTLNHNHSPFERGIAIHKLVEKLGSLPWKEDHIQDTAQQISYALKPWDLSALKHLANNPLYKIVQKYPTTYHELPYMVNDHNEILHGFMDFVAMNEQEIIIIDFKTDYVENEQILKDMYIEQMHTYKRAMQILYPDMKIKTFLYSLHFHKEIEI